MQVVQVDKIILKQRCF